MRFALTVVITSLIIGSAPAYSQPSVSEIFGSLDDTETVTITGGGFGSKVPAAPFRWDDFESGEPGTPVTGWQTFSPPTSPPSYDSKGRVPGDQSVYQNFRDHYACALMIYPLPSFEKMYVTGWWFNEVGGAPSRNVKLINWTGGQGYGNTENPQNRTDFYPNTGSGHLYATDSDGHVAQGWELSGDLYSGEWMRVERFVDITAGKSWIKRNLQMWADIEDANLYANDDAYTMLLITHYFAKDTGTPTPWMDSYWGELYIDTTPARVELGNADTWDGCTVREIQIPSAWSPTTISFAVHQGTFTSGQTAYLYVVNEDEQHNTVGFPVTIGMQSDPGDPPGEPGQPTRSE